MQMNSNSNSTQVVSEKIALFKTQLYLLSVFDSVDISFRLEVCSSLRRIKISSIVWFQSLSITLNVPFIRCVTFIAPYGNTCVIRNGSNHLDLSLLGNSFNLELKSNTNQMQLSIHDVFIMPDFYVLLIYLCILISFMTNFIQFTQLKGSLFACQLHVKVELSSDPIRSVFLFHWEMACFTKYQSIRRYPYGDFVCYTICP